MASSFVESFARMQSDSLERLKLSTDLAYLKNELKQTNEQSPSCTAESFFIRNKIGILMARIKELEDEIVPYFTYSVKNLESK